MTPKIADMEYYLHDVLNPEHLSGLPKKYRINVIETSDYIRRAEVHILALNETEAKKFVYNNLYEYDEEIDWDADSDNTEFDMQEMVEVEA